MTTIALTTDLTSPDDRALLTAAALAAQSGARLVSVHASTARDEDPRVGPPVADLTARWGRSIEHVPMIHTCCDDVTDTILDALQQIRPSLVVAGTEGRNGWLQLFASSVAEGVARNVDVPTLIVPRKSRDVVDARTGAIDLRRVLVPVGDAEAARAGLLAAVWLTRLAGAQDVEVVLLHVEDGHPAPELPPAPSHIRITSRTVPGPLEQAIVDAAGELDACVVVMPTRGHDGLVDAVSGSHTERVLRSVRCPVLSVPLGAPAPR